MQTVADQVAATCRGVLLREQSERRAERLAALERRHRELMERLVRAQEQERSRVAADLHDDTIQVMSACVISLDSVRLAIQDGNVERAARGLEQVADLISGAVERTRRMTFDLRPAVLWHHGLVIALEQSLQTMQSEMGIAATLEVEGFERADRLHHGDAHLPVDHRDPRQRARARGRRVGRRAARRGPGTSSTCASPTTAAASTSRPRWPAPGARTTWGSRR